MRNLSEALSQAKSTPPLGSREMPASAAPPLPQKTWTAQDGKKRSGSGSRSFRLADVELSERPFQHPNELVPVGSILTACACSGISIAFAKTFCICSGQYGETRLSRQPPSLRWP